MAGHERIAEMAESEGWGCIGQSAGRLERAGEGAGHGGVTEGVEGVERFVVGIAGEGGGGILEGRAGCGRFAAEVRELAEFPGGNAVEGGDLGGERAERGGLDILLVGLFFKVRVVVLQRAVILAKLVEVGGLDEHAGVGTRKACDGEETYGRRGDEDVGVMQRDGNAVERAVGLAADEKDVKALFRVLAARAQTDPVRSGEFLEWTNGDW